MTEAYFSERRPSRHRAKEERCSAERTTPWFDGGRRISTKSPLFFLTETPVESYVLGNESLDLAFLEWLEAWLCGEAMIGKKRTTFLDFLPMHDSWGTHARDQYH